MSSLGALGSLRCDEHARLAEEPTAATRLYARRVEFLNTQLGTLNEIAYRIERVSLELTRRRAEQAREALAKHRAEYGW